MIEIGKIVVLAPKSGVNVEGQTKEDTEMCRCEKRFLTGDW